MIIFAFLPWIFTACVWRWFSLRGFGVREGLLAANIVSAVLTVFSTEVLTLFHLLRFSTLFLFWSLALGVIIGILMRLPHAFSLSFPKIEFSLAEKILIGCGAVIVFIAGAIALIAPPNTWDSLTYHMARVAHWNINQGVMNYQTNIIRQLVYFPFAEYMILHSQILSGCDRFATIVQWGGFLVIGMRCVLDRRCSWRYSFWADPRRAFCGDIAHGGLAGQQYAERSYCRVMGCIRSIFYSAKRFPKAFGYDDPGRMRFWCGGTY